MSDSVYLQLLDLACGGLLLTAVLVLWRRDLAVIIRVFALQGLALAVLVAVLAAHERDVELAGVAVGILGLRAIALPVLLRRALAAGGSAARETRPLINVASSLLSAAALVLLAYAVSRPMTALDSSPAAHAIPVGVAVVLIGFFVLVTRRHPLSQLVGFLLLDNGITTVGFLTGTSVGLVVEVGVSLDVLLAVLVLQVLTTRLRQTWGQVDLDALRELHD